MIAFDIETKDPRLLSAGPGVYRKDGYVLGVAWADSDGPSGYIPLGHPGMTEDDITRGWGKVRKILENDTPKVGANVLYDLDWLLNGYGIAIGGTYNDVQIAEALLNEYRRTYALDDLARQYLGVGKAKQETETWCEARGLHGDHRGHLWMMPADLVGKYAIQDARLTLSVFNKQVPLLHKEELEEIYKLEVGILPLLLRMRKTGIRIDEARRRAVEAELSEKRNVLYRTLTEEFETEFNYNSSLQLSNIFTKLGIEFKLTDKGNPSIKNEDIEIAATKHPSLHSLAQLRKIDKVLETFIRGAFVDYAVNGRIHTTYRPVAHDEGGTVSGRLSSLNPNMQQLPGKDGNAKLGDLPLGTYARSVFIPENGCMLGVIDLSQIEFRMMVHYASGDAADKMREEYIRNPTADYHQLVADWTGLPRSDAKRVTFGVAFGMGKNKMAATYGWDETKISGILDAYYSRLPFLKATQRRVEQVATLRGYIKTLGGRHARYTRELREKGKSYIFFNRLMQGSAADYNKMFMLKAWQNGIFDVLYPHLTTHDEINVSVPMTRAGAEAFFELKRIMETAYTLKIPVVANAEVGHNLGTTTPVTTKEELPWRTEGNQHLDKN